MDLPSDKRWLSDDRSPIWTYARKMGLALYKVLPEDVEVSIKGGVYVKGTVNTMQEAEALREVIRHLGQTLPSHRKMIAADIGAGVREPSFRDKLYELFGDPTELTGIRSLGTQDT